MTARRTAAALACAVLVLLVAGVASARPGGGHSFGGGDGGGGFHGGGGSSFHSSGSHGGGDLGLTMTLVLLAATFGSVVLAIKHKTPGWVSTTAADAPEDGATRGLADLRARDRNFSRVLLDDFVHELYVRAHMARGDVAAMRKLAPYLSPEVRKALLDRGRVVSTVSAVVVGRADVVRAEIRGARDQARIAVQYEANFTETDASGTAVRIYARETWSFARRLSATSRPPHEVHAFNCPKCGAPVERDDSCAACRTAFDIAAHEWRCIAVTVHDEEVSPPPLGGYQPEQATDAPTLRSPELALRMAELREEDPEFDVASFEARVRTIYAKQNAAWSSLRWAEFRPWCTDRLWQSNAYWIDAYRDQGLRNRMDDAVVATITIAKVERDPFFWAITVRVFASAIDLTVHAQTGRIVGGSKKARSYSEYWTLVRAADRRGRASTDAQCPSCGAPLSVGLGGQCDHCGVKLTGGAFDWVLSKIEQDDVYRG